MADKKDPEESLRKISGLVYRSQRVKIFVSETIEKSAKIQRCGCCGRFIQVGEMVMGMYNPKAKDTQFSKSNISPICKDCLKDIPYFL
ncbi:MAG: hypothetical protein PHY56_00140 [Candidatus Omnitrophica bacterium]|nr:hypothetical protein [Candidatus Omnitrophota bacterium]